MEIKMNSVTSSKLSAICYVLWGVVHAMIGIQILVLNLGDSTHAVIAALYSDTGPVSTPEQLGSLVWALMNQHG
jgi:hypothetical protein